MNVAVAAPDRGVPYLEARGVKRHFGGAQALEAIQRDPLDNQRTKYINMN
jgi:hypothetical protein